MIAFLLARGLSPLISKLIAYVGIPLLILGLAYWALDSYGDRRFDEGVTETDAKWEAASDKLKAEAAASATRADDAAVVRLEEHVAQAEEDQAAVEKAIEEGKSPLDALFGG